MHTLGFSPSEQEDVFRCISAILLLGNLDFVSDDEGQAQFVDLDLVQKLCKVLGVGLEDFKNALLNPVIRAGQEIISQARDVMQVRQAVEALARALYERLFSHIVERINKAIERETHGSSIGSTTFIGVLDIAGFEIFEANSFEQLCVNYTNEKLQQFFNHHMFVIEQEEYRREGVTWEFIDFGLDLQPTIDLIEKSNPIGILACLDEDCVVPKATDKSYCNKLANLWKGKSPKFEMTRFGDSFTIQHYAGKVEYRTDGWLEKNKDPLNENITRLLAKSLQPILAQLFSDFGGTEEEIYRASRGTKRGQFRTVAQKYRESLTLLMQQLYSTRPHFVRCILPNEEKKSGLIEANLVLDQLSCNGVLEGIRICRLGFPNRVHFADFCRLYEILVEGYLYDDRKEATKQLLFQLKRDPSSFRIGQSKVFFKAGELGILDELRDKRLSSIIQIFQARCRGALARRSKTRLIRQNEAKEILQRNCRHFLSLKQWTWWRLYSRVKPLLNVTRAESRIEELEDELDRIQSERDVQFSQLRSELDSERDKLMNIESSRRELEREIQHMRSQLSEVLEAKAALSERLQHQEAENQIIKERQSQEILSHKEETRQKLEEQLAIEQEVRAQLEATKANQAELKAKIEEFEFERLRLQRNESTLRSKVAEFEVSVEELRGQKRDLEAKMKCLEEAKQILEEKLEDENLGLERQKEFQAAFDNQLRQTKARQEEELASLMEDFDLARKRLQREILQLSSELEQERKQSAGHLATIRKYESGTDNLASKLEAELRNQEGWKREKERLEAKIKELVRTNQESLEREDEQQAIWAASNEQVRSLRAQLGQLEDDIVFGERGRRQAEGKIEKLQENLAHVNQLLNKSEQTLAASEAKASDLHNRLAEEQDEVAVLKERLRASEHVAKLHQYQAEENRRILEEIQEEKVNKITPHPLF